MFISFVTVCHQYQFFLHLTLLSLFLFLHFLHFVGFFVFLSYFPRHNFLPSHYHHWHVTLLLHHFPSLTEYFLLFFSLLLLFRAIFVASIITTHADIGFPSLVLFHFRTGCLFHFIIFLHFTIFVIIISFHMLYNNIEYLPRHYY